MPVNAGSRVGRSNWFRSPMKGYHVVRFDQRACGSDRKAAERAFDAVPSSRTIMHLLHNTKPLRNRESVGPFSSEHAELASDRNSIFLAVVMNVDALLV